MADELFDFNEDEERNVQYEHDGTQYVLVGDGVFGFFRVTKKSGAKIPIQLDGQFTSIQEAQRTIQAYHTSMKHNKEHRVAA